MNFIAQVEEHLRDLGAEARQKHPGVKEASERAILQLRTLKNSYVTAVRHATQKGTSHPTTALFRSQDLLRPFLLAANYPNANPELLEISFKAMRHLIEGNAICPGDGIHLVRVWTIQANVCASHYKASHHTTGKTALSEDKTAAAVPPATSLSAQTSISSTTASNWLGGLASTLAGTSNTDNAALGVSSSSGTTGDRSTGGQKQMKEHERLAMEILGCLICLLELNLKDNNDMVIEEEQWSSAVALCCILLGCGDTLRQAAKSTLQRVLSLMYQIASDEPVAQRTWEDLLTIVSKSLTPIPESPSEQSRTDTLKGAFSHCVHQSSVSVASSNSSTTPHHKTGLRPPPATLCLELLHQIMTQQPQLFFSENALGDMFPATAVTFMQLLRSEQSFAVLWRSLQMVRVMILLQTQHWKPTCRELLLELVYGITAATEACRTNHDFEDGYAYFENEETENDAQHHNQTPKEGNRRRSSSNLKASTVSVPTTSTTIPDSLLWKAALVLEIIHEVLRETHDVIMEEDGTLVSIVTEAVSDFATIAASCQDNILQVVGCANEAYIQTKDGVSSIDPSVFQRAEEIGKSLDAGLSIETGKGVPPTKGTPSEDWFPPCSIGEPILLAFHCILLLSRSLGDLLEEEEENKAFNIRISSFMEGSFSPCLAVLQHYLKRFAGSRNLTEYTLEGYADLADVAVPKKHGNDLQRRALMTSLCKLSLPTWGKHDSASILQDCHIQALACLLKIVHKNYDSILSEWHVIISTLEELSTLSVSSPSLSDDGYITALTISASYVRLAPLSAALSLESLECLVDALADVSQASLGKKTDGDIISAPIVEKPPQTPRIKEDKVDKKHNDDHKTKDSIGGKLMSFAGRAIAAGMGSPAAEQNTVARNDDDVATNRIPNHQRAKKAYYEDYKREFQSRLSSSKLTRGYSNFGRLPFSLMLLTDAAMSNSFRFDDCGAFVSRDLCSLATLSADIRNYAMGTLTSLINSQFSHENDVPSASKGPRVIAMEALADEAYLSVKPVNVDSSDSGENEEKKEMILHDVLLAPLCDTLQSTDSADVAEAGISTLLSILEGAGHNLAGTAWPVVIDAISSLSGDVTAYGDMNAAINRSGTEWSTCCMLGFRCLKLIVDDFLDHLPPPTESSSVGARTALLDCCSSFGKSRHDVNTSLTAIGLLWSIADQDPDPKSIDRALAKMVFLSSDSRTEVRNCSVNTLFSCIVGRGQRYSASQWKAIICETVFGVFDHVSARGENEKTILPVDAQSPKGGNGKSNRYKVSVHHSRDSVGKQWATTEVMVLRGVNRLLRNFFSQLLLTMENDEVDSPWFETAWRRILNYSLIAAMQSGGRDTMELRKAGIDMLLVCCQLSCHGGIVAAITPARVGTNMEVVNGALRSVRDANSKSTDNKDNGSPPISDVTLRWRQKLFLDSFQTLEDLRYHFESDAEDAEEDNSHYVESVQLQVLHKLSEGLAKLYDCCKDEELSPEQDFEKSFVALVATVAKKAAGDAGSRFLTQAQRGCFDLLRTMTANSSSAALKVLASLAGESFFWVADSKKDDAIDPIKPEAAKVVADEFANERLSHESKVEVLCRILSAYAVEQGDASWDANAATSERKVSYELLVPVMQGGLESATLLETGDAALPEETNMQVNILWERTFFTLSRMLSPSQIFMLCQNSELASHMMELILAVTVNAREQDYEDCGVLLSEGTSNSLAAAKQQVSSSKTQGPSTVLVLKGVIKVFKACLEGLCKILPNSDVLQSVIEVALRDAIGLISTDDENERKIDLGEAISLSVCGVLMSEQGLESTVIAVFRQLCLLTSVENVKLRTEVSLLLSGIDLAEVLEDSFRRTEEAEERALEAERRNAELEAEIDDLQDENDDLQQQVAVFMASSAIS